MTTERIEIRPFCNDDKNYFKEMFCTYFRNDFKIDITDNELEEICNQITEGTNCKIISLDILLIDEEFTGFVIYQIDNPQSDCCEREGWGFIREIYIKSSMRSEGLGKTLVAHTEQVLYGNSVEHIYLTSDEAGEFWSLCGYRKTGKVSDLNHIPIYEK